MRQCLAEILAMHVGEAKSFFDEPDILPALERLDEVGLAYLSLGQPLSSLSGGERQRLKLATELAQSCTARTSTASSSAARRSSSSSTSST